MGDLIQSKPWDRVERRAHRRAPLQAPVIVEDSLGTRTLQCLNVSAGGVAVRLEAPWIGALVVGVYFELPFGFAVESQAQVLRKTDGMIALQFLDLTHEALVALRGFSRLSTSIRAVRISVPGTPQ
jgi:hypothetical protein